MNCKPGDLAYVLGSSKYAGRVVEVLSRVPQGVDFMMPDGYTHVASSNDWLIRFVGAPVECPMGFRGKKQWSRLGNYATAPDRKLRPISGLTVNDEVTDDIKERA
jgi:hypothetical protein